MSIGLEHKGEVVAGVVYDPIKDEIFVAEKGAGAWLNDRRLRVSGRREMIEMIFATGIPFGGRPELPRHAARARGADAADRRHPPLGLGGARPRLCRGRAGSTATGSAG